ncbi:MAG: SsrA-binding protein SmpB [Candidatus Celaenobacter antarcticus]|nr:SsrA-binding protein SmpB [Candidatus Celaenobacter antarcticus]MDP8313963.1 SsrA-binding protein SmpB [Candidatus Celaenobacter antarcticus]
MEFKNKKAARDYYIEKTYEAGIVLTGNEIKSIREGRVNFTDSYARVKEGELWLENLHISPYDKGFNYGYNPKRPRKLLMHKYEIHRLENKTAEKGYTLIPVSLFINENGLAKIIIGLAKGRRAYEKRDKIKARDADREMDRAMRR